MDIHHVNTQEILDKISRHCPRALSTYIHCLNRKSKNNTVYFSREMIENEMSETWAIFKNNIKKLAIEGLLEWHLIDDGIAVHLSEMPGEDNDECLY